MTKMRGRIAIAGAGLGGLTAALALLRDGWSVSVYEQAPVVTEVGAGITISTGAAKGLSSLGVESALVAASVPVPNVAFAHYRTGALLAGAFEQDELLDRGIETARHIHRADLHAILLAAVWHIDPQAVVTAKKITEVTQDSAQVTMRFADKTEATADMLIAADGARSAVRRCLFDDVPPDFAGQIAFRCLIPSDIAAPYMARGRAVVSVGPARIFHRYVIRGGDLVNVIGLAQSDRWREEGWNTPATIDEFLEEYRDFHPDVLGLIRCAPAQHLIKWGLFVRPPITNWSVGRVALLGDAAHPILPFLGLGAALALEDGVVLARALAMTQNVERAFAAYQAARVDRVDTVRVQSIRQGEIIQATNPDQYELAQAPAQSVALFDYDPCTAEIHV